MTPAMAHHIHVERRSANGPVRVLIDGEELPWYITDSGPKVCTLRGQMPGVTLTVMAERVTVDDDLGESEAGS